MKKYRQLLLVVLSIVSLTLFLVYRHEYNRLHYVLEVFNFFGKPCNLSELVNSNVAANHYDWGPEPLFNEEDGLSFYSSYWLGNNEARTFMVKGINADHARSCYLWYEDIPEAVVGTFKYSQLLADGANNLEMYSYFCSSTKKNVPYAVSYSRKKKKYMKKHLLNFQYNSVAFNTTICLVGSANATKRIFIENISFHSLVGVDSFLIYTNALPYKVIKTVRNLSKSLNINITFYPFNIINENSALIKTLVEQDCLLRTITHSKFVTTLNVDEFIVPSTQNSLNDAFNGLNIHSDRLNLAVQRFCINSVLLNQPMPVQNTNSIYDSERIVQVVYRNRLDSSVIREQGVDEGSISVHKYIYCDKQAVKMYEDRSMLKFRTDFQRMTLYQLMLNKQL